MTEPALHTPKDLTATEFAILREIAGQLPPRPWGAAVAAVTETLRSKGYIDGGWILTAKGERALPRHRDPQEDGAFDHGDEPPMM